MSRKILSAALLISLLMGTLWQTMTPTLQAAKTTAQWKTQKTGSAGVLIGKSVLVSIFVEDADSKWNEKQKRMSIGNSKWQQHLSNDRGRGIRKM